MAQREITPPEYKEWTVGKIESVDTNELDKRVKYLIKIREYINKNIQAELDYIYHVVEYRAKKRKYE